MRESDPRMCRRIDARIYRSLFGFNVIEERSPLFSSDIGAMWALVEYMRSHGSSVDLNWGEDTGCWECSWITGGERYTGAAMRPQVAVCLAAVAAINAKEAAGK